MSSSLLTRFSGLAAQRLARPSASCLTHLPSRIAHPRHSLPPPSLLSSTPPSFFHSLPAHLSSSSSLPPYDPRDDDEDDDDDDDDDEDEDDMDEYDEPPGSDYLTPEEMASLREQQLENEVDEEEEERWVGPDGEEIEEVEPDGESAEVEAEPRLPRPKTQRLITPEEMEAMRRLSDWPRRVTARAAVPPATEGGDTDGVAEAGEGKTEGEGVAGETVVETDDMVADAERKEGQVEVKEEPPPPNIDWGAEGDLSTVTEFSEDMSDIIYRARQDMPLTVNQKVVLIEHWLKKLDGDPREGFGVHPMITWTHPRGPKERPGRETPRMEEQFVPYPYSPALVDAMHKDSKAKRTQQRKGVPTAYVLERAAYREKMRDVRKAYAAEFAVIKARRDGDVVKEWKAVKAAAAERRQVRREQQRLDLLETKRVEEEEYKQRLQEKRERIEARVREVAQQRRMQAQQAARLLQERRRRWINDGDDASWGVRIDERVFAQPTHSLVGFWPTRH